MSARLPTLCIVGPLLGTNPGWVVSQGEIIADKFRREGYRILTTSSIPHRFLRLLDTVKSLIQWRKDIEIVVVMVFSGPAFAIADIASWVTRALGKPLILWLHGGHLPEFARKYSYWTSRVIRRGNIIVSPSSYLACSLASLEHPIAVIPNVLALEDYSYRHRLAVRPRLLWMRTFHEVYHPTMAVNVLREIQRVVPEVKLTMAGQEKGEFDRVKELVCRFGLQGSVSFPGFLNGYGKKREFAQHDIFLNTNRVDNMPVSVLEAAACGLPIVATNVGGIPHMLQDGDTALLVESEDVAGMSDAVCRLLGDPSLAARLSANGRRLAEQSAWPNVRRQWESLFGELLTHG